MIDSSAKVKLTLCVMQLQPNACRLHVVERYRRPKLCCSKKIEHTVKAACLSASTVVSMLLCFEKFALVIPQ